jgi:hypothetical protein
MTDGALFPITIPGVMVYGVVLAAAFYLSIAALTRRWPRLEAHSLSYAVVMFMLFGAAGEEVVNKAWNAVFGSPLWQYRLYPAQDGDISYLFFQVWGLFGFYSYLRDRAFPAFGRSGTAWSALVFGIEAIVLELAVNVPFHALFGDYIFYYLPTNLGPLSHFSCLQVVPFYMAIAFASRRLIAVQEAAGYRHLKCTLGFYLMVMVAYVWL